MINLIEATIGGEELERAVLYTRVARSRLQSSHLGDAWWWRVETLELYYRAVPPAALCMMCYVHAPW